MKKIIALEEAAQCIIALLALRYQPVVLPMWGWALLFFSPDSSMLGYLAGPQVGAFTYNLAHHKGIALLIFGIGCYLTLPVLVVAGILLYAHSSFDRMLGYGLKQERGFEFTHLGKIGRKPTGEGQN